MWKFAGLSHLSDKELFLIALIGICASFAIGWIMHLIMDRVGFGIFGNAFISLLGLFLGASAYSHYYGRLNSPNLPVLMTFLVASVMLHLVVLSVLRRLLRL